MAVEIRKGFITFPNISFRGGHLTSEIWIAMKDDGPGYNKGDVLTFGGLILDSFHPQVGRRVGTDYGMEFIQRVMETTGVTAWHELPGKSCRILAEDSDIFAIGHATEEKWFRIPNDLDFLRK